MASSKITIKKNLIQSEMEYKAFIQAFLHFLILYFKENSCFSITYNQRARIEKNMVSSLMMIEILHFQLVVRNSLCKQIVDLSDDLLQTNELEHRETIRKLLLNIKKLIKDYQFFDENDKQCSKKILKHLLQYYEKCTVIFDPPITTPWIANQENIYPYPYYWRKENEV